MSDIGDTQYEMDILDYIERSELSHQNTLNFDTFISFNEIEQHIIKKNSIKKDENYQFFKSAIKDTIESLIYKKKIIRMVFKGKEIGYRSKSAEITRLLYKLKLKTNNNNSYIDIATLKTTITNKIIPSRNRELNDLKEEIKVFLDENQNLYGLNPIEILIRSLEKLGYINLSEFQVNSFGEIFRQIENEPHSVVITASTGAGKTIAFLLAPILYAISSSLKDEKFTKAIFVYPRKALAEDQYNSINSLLYEVNNQINNEFSKMRGYKPKKIVVENDFGSVGRNKQDEIYESDPDFIVTTTETLKRRMMYYKTHNSLKNLKFVIFDEIHLYSGMSGSNTIYLIKRLKSLLNKYDSKAVYIGASATIAEPGNFCKKLFSLSKKPSHISSNDFEQIIAGHTHHVFLKPVADRPALSVLIDATSCIIHNRRNGLFKERNNKNINKSMKTIGFADSLDTIGQWNTYLSDFEKTKAYSRAIPTTKVGYTRYYKPCGNDEYCNNFILMDCENYISGSCWTLSSDNGEHFQELENGKKYRTDAIRSNISTSNFDNKGKNIFDDEKSPWFWDIIIASPVLEVGVDIDNVKEVLLFKAIRSPSSYRQKIGRSGREVGTESYCASVISNSPIDNYYFRNYLKLVSGSLPIIPLNDDNIDIASSHLISGIIDFIASNNLDIFSVGYLNNPENEFLNAKNLIIRNKLQLSNYLKGIYDNKDLIDKAILNFLRNIDRMLDKSLFESINFKIEGTTPSFVFLASKLTMNKKNDYLNQIETQANIISKKLEPDNKKISSLEDILAEIWNQIGDVPSNYREDLICMLMEIEDFTNIQSNKKMIITNLDIIAEEIYKKGKQYASIVTNLSELMKMIAQFEVDTIRLGEEKSKLENIKKFISNARSNKNYGIFLDSVMRDHPDLQNNWLPPATLFENSKKKKVTLNVEGKYYQEDLDLVFNLLYPGKHSWRYGKIPIKVNIREWPDTGSGEVSISMQGLEKLPVTINSTELPKDIQFKGDDVPIYTPKSLMCSYSKKDVPICLTCGRATDGKEYCSHYGNDYHGSTLPKGSPLIFSHVKYESENEILTPSSPLSNIFSNISYSTEINVRKILYGFERYVSREVFRVYYDKLLGYEYTTEGLIYNLKDVETKIKFFITDLEDNILRDLCLMQLTTEFYDFLRSNYISIWDAMTIFKAILLMYLKNNGIPKTPDEIKELLNHANSNKGQLNNILDELYEQKNKQKPTNITEIFDKITEFKLTNYEEFVKKVYMHTLAHYIYVSTILLLGIDEKDIGYNIDYENESIIIFDSVEGGNGCAKTMHEEKSLLSIDVSKNLDDIKDNPSISPSSRDLFSYIEELAVGCPEAEADSILISTLNEKKKDITNILEPNERKNRIMDEIRNKNIDESELFYLDGILKQNLHIPLMKLENYNDIFIYSFVPEYLIEKLSNDEKIEILPDYSKLESDEAFLRISEIVKDSLSICINSCPSCLLISNCNEGFTNSRYTLDRRIIENLICKIKDPISIEYNGDVIDTARKCKLLLENGEKSVYISGKTVDKFEILKSSYSLLGYRINKQFIRLSNFTIYENKFSVKLEMT